MGTAGHGIDPFPDPKFAEKRFKFSGFGGQGVLSLGTGHRRGGRRRPAVTSPGFPATGRNRGAVPLLLRRHERPAESGSPTVDSPDVLVCMNQPALEKFGSTVSQGGVLIYEASLPVKPDRTETTFGSSRSRR